MVARKFQVRHEDSSFDVEYDTDDAFEVLKFQLFSLTSILPDDQKIVSVDDGRLLTEDSDLVSVSENFRLVSISEEEKQKEGELASSSVKNDAELVNSDEDFARMLQAEEEALMLQQFVAVQNYEQLESKIKTYTDQVRLYEDPIRQEAARKTVPVHELEEEALILLAKVGNFRPKKIEVDHTFLLQLLFWFKKQFRWVDSPPCDGCGNKTKNQGMGAALPAELEFGASRVELYCCQFCARITRFPRYKDPLKLIETRRGRCGEWANCFTHYCRAFGYEVRLVLDFTDHLWTECYSQLFGRWLHFDPCEAAYDKPLLYEKGWKKKLNYIIAIGRDGVYDVTKRYTRKWHEVLSRRNLITEQALTTSLSNLTKQCRVNLTSQFLFVLEERDRKEKQELEGHSYSVDDSSVALPGRQSGDKEWRKSRLEIGSDEDGFVSNSGCPHRKCIDEHVRRVYNAFYPILCQFNEDELSKTKVVEVLKFIKRILIDLKKSPFRTRRTLMIADSFEKSPEEQFFPSLKELLIALSLTSHSDSDRGIDICLASAPVKTSLALPVALDALDEMLQNIQKCNDFDKSSLTLPLLKLNRIHSGSVLASGEELPFGIVTSAFDGTSSSKWEEPNGASGILMLLDHVHSLDNQLVELVAYEFVSANDAPERDPMDWILKGSVDYGLSWYVLDKQTGQRFEDRFQRKTFKFTSGVHPSNMFRFTFLAVRDVESTSRLQLGSIDLYGSE